MWNWSCCKAEGIPMHLVNWIDVARASATILAKHKLHQNPRQKTDPTDRKRPPEGQASSACNWLIVKCQFVVLALLPFAKFAHIVGCQFHWSESSIKRISRRLQWRVWFQNNDKYGYTSKEYKLLVNAHNISTYPAGELFRLQKFLSALLCLLQRSVDHKYQSASSFCWHLQQRLVQQPIQLTSRVQWLKWTWGWTIAWRWQSGSEFNLGCGTTWNLNERDENKSKTCSPRDDDVNSTWKR